MATTTNYGWTTPDDTALVKDGASAIRALGTAIDTSMNTALGTKKSGLVLLNTTSFSAVSSTSLAANTFTSTYQNYRVIFVVNSVSTTSSVNMRLRASGTDDTSANYDYQGVTGVGSTASAFPANNDTTFQFFATSRDTASLVIMDIIQPQATAQTFVSGISYVTDAGANQQTYGYTGRFQLTTSFDAATFICSSGNFTGNYSVFAYNK